MKLTFLYNPVSQIQRVKYKLLIVMKLTAILLLIGTLHLSAASFSQSVTISRKNATLETIFKDIKQQTGYLFFYTGKVKASDQRLNVELKNVPLNEALKICLQNDNLNFTIVNKTIVLSPKATEQTTGKTSAIISISGRVVDKETNQPIPGVNISLKSNRSVRSQTNGDGNFKIEANPGDVLIFSYIGYKLKEVKITDANMTVVLESEVNTMNDVVVTGYQTIKKDSFTGTAIAIKGADLKRVNPQNLLASIQTFDPSFKLIDNNLLGSNPNAIPSINVRGSSALPTGSTDVLRRDNIQGNVNMPAFILDGYEVNAQKIFDLDINRVESVTLLKDAAATAIYGARAANGVLVIVTKAPQEGKLRVSYNYEVNVTGADLSDYNVLNAKDKLEYEVLAGLYTTGDSKASQDILDAAYYHRLANVVGGVNTYWLSQPVRTTAGQKHSLYLEGGSQAFRYGVDLRYQTRPGVMKGSGRDQYSGGMNFSYNVNKLQFRNDLSITQVNGKESPYGAFSNYVKTNPYYPLADASGKVIREIDIWDKQDTNNPEIILNPLYDATLSSFDKSSYTEIIDNLSAEMEIAKDLRLKGQMSLTSRMGNDDLFRSPQSNEFYFYETAKIDEKGSYTSRERKETYWDGNIRLTWLKQIADHYFNVLAGVNIRTELSDAKEFTAIGFANDRFSSIGFAKGYAENGKPNSRIEKSRLFGSFVGLNYSFKNKYLLDASVRIDGSSKFGVDNKLAPFWSLGLGWNLHNEEFLKGHPVISQLRLRASTGLTGSVLFDPYLSRTTYNYVGGNWYSSGIGANVRNYGNENLSWQKTLNTDIGLELGLFHDRVYISPKVYRKFTKDILADITLPPSTGFLSYKENLGDMENKGAELNMRWDVVRSKDWSVNLMANLVSNKNRIVRISNSLKSYNDRVDNEQTKPVSENGFKGIPLLRFNEGQSINAIYAVRSLGIDPENGRELYIKRDGTLTYDYDIKDIVVVGNADSKLDGSFGGTFTYKRFMLNAVFQTRVGGDMYNQTLVDRVENADARFNVDRRVFEDKWKTSGDRTFYKNIADLGTTDVSSRFVQPDNSINLQSVNFSYDVDQRLAKKISMSNLRLSLTANDIARWSSVKQERGIDYPFARSVTFSINAIF